SHISPPSLHDALPILQAALTRIKEYTNRRKRLLVVEDDRAEQMSIAELLSHDDIEIVTIGTGSEALRLLREDAYDCVVLDLRLRSEEHTSELQSPYDL